jgi:hypothetical protein
VNPDEQGDDDVQEIPLPNVKTSILAKVIEFLEHYKTEPMNEIEKVGLVLHQVFVSLTFSLAFEVGEHERGCARMVFEFRSR